MIAHVDNVSRENAQVKQAYNIQVPELGTFNIQEHKVRLDNLNISFEELMRKGNG